MPKPSKAALFGAAKAWDAATTEALLATARDFALTTDLKGRTALHLACAVKPSGLPSADLHGLKTVAALLKAGADLEAAVPADKDEGDHRSTPLWFAVARGENLPLVQFLLTRGADPSTCLWAVVWRDDEVFCRELLKHKPRLNLRAHGETPMFYAARLQRLKTLRLAHRGRGRPHDRGQQGPRCDRYRARPPPAEGSDRSVVGVEGAGIAEEIWWLMPLLFFACRIG